MSRWWKAPGHKLKSESWARGACSLTGERVKDTEKGPEGSVEGDLPEQLSHKKAPPIQDQRGLMVIVCAQLFLFASSISLMPPTLLSTPVAS